MSSTALVIRGTVMGSLYAGGSYTPQNIPEEILGVWGAPTQVARPGDIVTLTPDEVTRLAALGFVKPL
jgi:hypothetical protein